MFITGFELAAGPQYIVDRTPYLGSISRIYNYIFGRLGASRHRFESCRQAGILISGLFERIGSGRLCILKHKIALLESIWLKSAVLRAAARLESLSRVSLRDLEAAGFTETTVLRAAAKLESLSPVSLKESEAAGFA